MCSSESWKHKFAKVSQLVLGSGEEEEEKEEEEEEAAWSQGPSITHKFLGCSLLAPMALRSLAILGPLPKTLEN